MDFNIPQPLQDLRQKVRKFVDTALIPWEDYVEEHEQLPAEVIKDLSRQALELGLSTFSLPVEVGGGGLGTLAECLVIEELWRADPGVVSRLPYPPKAYLKGNAEQRERYLFPVMRGERRGCFALTEPDTGSDASNIKTSAKRREDGSWEINGYKRFITDGDVADFAMVFAVTNPESKTDHITAFLVDRNTPGYIVEGEKARSMGNRGLHHVELVFKNCVVPHSSVFGEVGKGFDFAKEDLIASRLMVGAMALGPMARLIDEGLDYSKKRVQFGKPIGEYQAIQLMLADCAVDLFASRMMVYNAAWDADQGVDFRVLNAKAAAVKVFVAEAFGRVADRVLQIFGGNGYLSDRYVERAYRNARVHRIWEGTSEIQRLMLARSMLKRGMFT